MDHQRAPVLEAIAEHRRLDRYGLTPPAHRQGRGVDPRVLEVLGLQAFQSDLLASSGMDDRSSSRGILQEAQELLADAVGADRTFFSTCGSSLSVKASMLAVAGGDGDILIGRDAHKSVTAGIVLSGLRPRWISPRWDGELHLAHPPAPEDVEAMWERWPDARACLITSPTPYGTCADIAAIAEICHRRGKPLIIDEAWGAHLPFHEDLPSWAMSAGADLCVVSVHKMGTGFEQGSAYHLQGDLIDPVRLSQCADVLSTTSSNTLIYAGIDGWRRQMVQHGTALVQGALDVSRRIRREVEGIPGLHVLEEELLAAESSHELDVLHVLIDLSDLGISGYQAADWLRSERRLDMHTSDHRRVEALVSLSDDDGTADRLLAALQDMATASSGFPEPGSIHLPPPGDLEMETVMLPRDAFFGPVEDVPAEEAVGRVAAEQITPYPPGIPAILPGELIDGVAVDYLRSGAGSGMVLPDPADASVRTIRVVRR
jgi:arginine decarboxylase